MSDGELISRVDLPATVSVPVELDCFTSPNRGSLAARLIGTVRNVSTLCRPVDRSPNGN